MPLARIALDLVRREYLPSLLSCDKAYLTEALNIGREWLGQNHPAVQCLEIGIAVHHGQLPRPFLRAVERLLKDQHLKVTIASPTLAQGLNLSATTVLFCSLTRAGERIKGEEFANVAGRAGRAFVDVEGQVLCTVMERRHRIEWEKLLDDAKHRDLKSGLLQLIIDFCERIAFKKDIAIEEVLAYVTANTNIWIPPKPEELNTDEEKKEQEEFEKKWRTDLACLDSAILSIVQHDVPLEALAAAIDEALKSSLWERSLRRETEVMQQISKTILERRATLIWKKSTPIQRKGYFFAGVSLTTGLYLDKHADQLNASLLAADAAFADRDIDAACEALIALATIAFDVEPFAPDDLPADWMDILKAWVSGHSMSDLAGDKDEDMLEFIEGALVYRLVWAMEAVRVRASAEDENLEWPNAGRAALALETGTPNYCAALLIQSGLSSRIAAMKAVTDCTADFTDLKGLRKWAGSKPVIKRQLDPKWPTPETASLWHGFVNTLAITSTAEWVIQTGEANVTWHGQAMDAGKEVRLIFDPSNNGMRVFTPGLDPIGFLPYKWGAEPSGIALGKVSDVPDKLVITYLGPSDFFSKP